MTTFNHSITGFVAGNAVAPVGLLNVPDADASGNASAVVGGMQHTMRTGTLVLCKGLDGGLHWYRFDAARSTPANPVLLYVGP